MKRLMPYILITALCIVAALTVVNSASSTDQFKGHRTGNQRWQWRYHVWMPGTWQRLAQCESGSKPPNWRHDSGTYQGAFGFHHSSWDRFKPVWWWPANAANATPWQQYRTALAIHKRYGFTGWGCAHHYWVLHA